jgi:hypothetical protein
MPQNLAERRKRCGPPEPASLSKQLLNNHHRLNQVLVQSTLLGRAEAPERFDANDCRCQLRLVSDNLNVRFARAPSGRTKTSLGRLLSTLCCPSRSAL